MIVITTEQDSQLALQLRQLLDIAIKAGGIGVAEVAVHIDKLIVEAGRKYEFEKMKESLPSSDDVGLVAHG